MNADDERSVELVAEGDAEPLDELERRLDDRPVGCARRLRRGRTWPGERRVRSVRDHALVNRRVIGCGTLGAVVFVGIGLFGIWRASAPAGVPGPAALPAGRVRAGRFDRRSSRSSRASTRRSSVPAARRSASRAGRSTSSPGSRRRPAASRSRSGSCSTAATGRSRRTTGGSSDPPADPAPRQPGGRRQAGLRARPARRRGASRAGCAARRALLQRGLDVRLPRADAPTTTQAPSRVPPPTTGATSWLPAATERSRAWRRRWSVIRTRASGSWPWAASTTWPAASASRSRSTRRSTSSAPATSGQVDAGWVVRDGDGGRPFFEAAGVGVDAIGFLAVEIAERRGWWRAVRALCEACACAARRCGSRSTASPTARAAPRSPSATARTTAPASSCLGRRRPDRWRPRRGGLPRHEPLRGHPPLPRRRAPEAAAIEPRIGQYRARRVEIVGHCGGRCRHTPTARASASRRSRSRSGRGRCASFAERARSAPTASEAGRHEPVVRGERESIRHAGDVVGRLDDRASPRPGDRSPGSRPGARACQSIRSRMMPMARRCSRSCCSRLVDVLEHEVAQLVHDAERRRVHAHRAGPQRLVDDGARSWR